MTVEDSLKHDKIYQRAILRLEVLNKEIELDRKYYDKAHSWHNRTFAGFSIGATLIAMSVFSPDFYKGCMNPFRDLPAISSYNSMVDSLKNAYVVKNGKMGFASLDSIIGELEDDVKKAEDNPDVRGYIAANDKFIKYRALPAGVAGLALTFASIISRLVVGGFYRKKKKKELEAFKKTSGSEQ